ncbi:NUDIX hydrolase [Hoyosella altamirensis]|uniref:8-oxo-dGTP pyrophosphatase MutT (NUDIX family) n=1 Tax=Hoyosella altamirensis TaxID=616997 RepID=A0A839RHN0_9ACTN|nr:NUDIX domain-containing protein [Hoyosella altamirensis]MBB3035789.1 8-oxo-dGTP pyrophosphatase MutT (NUDIX family) [Hoyosella altamirensis]
MAVPDFVLKLRQHIGHDMLWLPSVSAVIFDDAANVLLAERADNGRWAVISGILEPGEHPAPAIKREISEEAGIEVDLLHLASVDVSPEIVHANGDQCQYLDLCFTARYVAGTAHPADDENTAVAWFSPQDLPEGLSESSRVRIRRAVAALDSGEPRENEDVIPWFLQ